MKKRSTRKVIFTTVTTTLTGLALFGLSLGTGVSESQDPDLAALHLVANALDKIETNPHVSLTSRDLIYAGINGMFRTLDPYTQFINETDFEYMQAQQQGSFYGIGISFDVRDGELLVIAPIEDSPAYKLGIRAGDVVAEIEGESAAGITTTDVISKLRGEKGSKVRIGIRREGEVELLQFEITRDRIKLESVRGGFMLDQETGYVRLTEFTATTHTELAEKMKILTEQGMKQLVMDLRFNGGGLLSAAEEVSSMFLRKGQTIVSTRGRATGSEMDLRCRKEGEYSELPIIILVNDSSASASEIVSGAVQDHDRGLVIGTETHGKGLVGSQFHTRLGTAAQITTAQYFTPSGRFIQRPFDIPHRDINDEDNAMNDEAQEKFRTDTGRTMYGRGGITPDVIIEEPRLSDTMFRLESMRVFFDFAVSHEAEVGEVTLDYTVTDEIYQEFIEYLQSGAIVWDTEALETDADSIRKSILRELVSVYVDSNEADKLRVLELVTIREALSLFPKINELLTPSTTPRATAAESDVSVQPVGADS